MALTNSEKQKRFREKRDKEYEHLKKEVERMKYKIYSIYDSKVEAYLPPLYYKSKGEFLRAFEEAANDSKSNIGKYPADFTAFEIGTFDDAGCVFELHKTPMSLGVAIEYQKGRLQDVPTNVAVEV